ncbi:MAG: phosphotransferase, partial [Kiritimatiellaeota bacterium]|nr:phosphotransferase [Kiritimatiellota bacterium]
NFHNAVLRLAALRDAVRQDPHGRAAAAAAEIAFVEQRAAQCARLLDRQQRGELPERITHNDTKLNNIMLDEQTDAAVCVIDLDTVMPGLALYDFGDMVRTATAAALEDERDLSRVFARPEMFAALARGYLSEAGFLAVAEREELVFSGRLITLVIGIRFLTDHLLGDVYFKIHRPDHNLDRCRTQFKMVASLEAQAGAMEQTVADALRQQLNERPKSETNSK